MKKAMLFIVATMLLVSLEASAYVRKSDEASSGPTGGMPGGAAAADGSAASLNSIASGLDGSSKQKDPKETSKPKKAVEPKK